MATIERVQKLKQISKGLNVLLINNDDSPNNKTEKNNVFFEPYFWIKYPDKGEIKTDNNPAKEEAPTINVRDQPKSSLIGYTKTAIVKVAAAFLTNIVEPDPATIIHP